MYFPLIALPETFTELNCAPRGTVNSAVTFGDVVEEALPLCHICYKAVTRAQHLELYCVVSDVSFQELYQCCSPWKAGLKDGASDDGHYLRLRNLHFQWS